MANTFTSGTQVPWPVLLEEVLLIYVYLLSAIYNNNYNSYVITTFNEMYIYNYNSIELQALYCLPN